MAGAVHVRGRCRRHPGRGLSTHDGGAGHAAPGVPADLRIGGNSSSAMGSRRPDLFAGAPPRFINFMRRRCWEPSRSWRPPTLFRPQRKEVMLTGEEEVEVRALLRDHGDRDLAGVLRNPAGQVGHLSPSHKAPSPTGS